MTQRIHVIIRGAVQGVGFRPFVYRLASELRLPGWVLNSPQGVFIEAEGEKDVLDSFLLRLEREKPPLAFIQSLEFSFLDPVHFKGFEIRFSSSEGSKNTLVLPDVATCRDCLREVMDPGDRRYRYPFTNCTNCGPRFTIIESLPYDRANTSMKKFPLCPSCRREYEDPLDRRFHAQPNACPDCGPEVALWSPDGRTLSSGYEAISEAAEAISRGKILAVKGLGGFHLMADACSDDAVAVLRERKRREQKPLALMFPSLKTVKEACMVSPLEERLHLSPESPIVLLRRRDGSPVSISPGVAPGNPYLGVMLPYTPLHHLLLDAAGIPVVATSGNMTDEPICIDEFEALERLRRIADLFLVHDRPIVRHVDDSIVRVVLGRELVLRRARGYAPLPFDLGSPSPPILAVGAHLKNAVAMTVENNVFISQHIGDLETPQASDAFRKVISSFRGLYHAEPTRIAADMHPDYISTRFAAGSGLPLHKIQHHFAHVASCMAENGLEGPVLGVSWDGTGYGPDGTVWGGEFLRATLGSFVRVATLRRYRLPGGEKAVKEPRRAAAGVLYALMGDSLFDQALPSLDAFSPQERTILRRMLARGLNSPRTSSAGRLFDAVASVTGLRQIAGFEGQAAMELEFAAERETGASYPFSLAVQAEPDEPQAAGVTVSSDSRELIIVDWGPTILAILDDLRGGASAAAVAAGFHLTLAEIILSVARRIGLERVVLTGGCFQNRLLTEHAVGRLEAGGFRTYRHQRIPPNDGGIALGQAVAALHSSPEGNAAGSKKRSKREVE